MDTNEFDDSLDGSVSKPTISPLLLDTIEKSSGTLFGVAKHIKELGNETDERVLEIVDIEKEVTAFGIGNKHDIPDRTAGNSLKRLKKKGILTSSYEMRVSSDGKRRLNHIYRRLEKKDDIKGRKGKRNIKKV